MRISTRLILVLSLLAAVQHLSAQTPASAPNCSFEKPVITDSSTNIFNERQEQDLGDILAEMIEPNIRLAAPMANDRLTRVGEKLLGVLPPTNIHYSFRVYDSGEINAFSTAGGRVYVSRKMIAALKNEDQLAGLLAHEIGHLYTHQQAISMTRMLHDMLGVNEVGDRADIYAKIQKLFGSDTKTRTRGESEGAQQMVADRLAMFALLQAGYAPMQFADLMNDTMVLKGRKGNWLTDMVRNTAEDEKRYRTTLKIIDELPQGCRERKSAVSAEFDAWKQKVVEERLQTQADTIEGDKPLKLDPHFDRACGVCDSVQTAAKCWRRMRQVLLCWIAWPRRYCFVRTLPMPTRRNFHWTQARYSFTTRICEWSNGMWLAPKGSRRRRSWFMTTACNPC